MLSLLPEKAVQFFKLFDSKRWGQSLHLEKVALVLAYTERVVSHARLSQFSDEHTRDIGDCLQKLEKQGRLISTGAYRAKTYHLPHQSAPSPEEVFDSPNLDESSTNLGESSTNLDESFTNLDESSTNLDESSTNLDENGRIKHSSFSFPFIEKLETLEEGFRCRLEKLASKPREKKSIPKAEMQQVILELCREQYISVNALSELVNRELGTLRGQYLKPLKDEGKLAMAFPRTPNDPRQAYLTIK